ncbi:hypothetical protein AMTRI_Chr10g226520 [Amborella trichopoda]
MLNQTTISKPTYSRLRKCLLSPLFLLPLIIITISSIITTISAPNILCNSNGQNTQLPKHIFIQIGSIQAQLGTILHDLHTQPQNNQTRKYADSVLSIALSIDKLAHELSKVHNIETEEINAANKKREVIKINTVNVKRGENDTANAGRGGTNVGNVEREQVDVSNEEREDGSCTDRLFISKELEYYTVPKTNKNGRKNFLGLEAIYPSVGLACKALSVEVDTYMAYKPYEQCPDDWITIQKLMVMGCDPPPRRRCFSRYPKNFTSPISLSSSLWSLPSDNQVLWTHYKCKRFSCLLSKNVDRGFFKCSDCFNLTKQAWLYPTNASESAEFTIEEVLKLKPDEIRIGLDFSPTTGTFAAMMREKGVTVASATLNLGAPFSEVIALRGLLPLYLSIGSRLPFFDNTLDIVHSTLFLDGWIDLEFLEYILFDWDRVLRPGGILWIDRFFCAKEEMEKYLAVLMKLQYRKHLWRLVPKVDREGGELFFSAVMEKPSRA